MGGVAMIPPYPIRKEAVMKTVVAYVTITGDNEIRVLLDGEVKHSKHKVIAHNSKYTFRVVEIKRLIDVCSPNTQPVDNNLPSIVQ
jgi:hypothetical protein